MKTTRLTITGNKEDYPRLIQAYRRCRGGRQLGVALRPLEERGLVVVIDAQGARQWTAELGDAPQMPSQAVSPTQAVSAMKAFLQKPGRANPITLRGQWSGVVEAGEGHLVVRLKRRIVGYGELQISSGPDGWSWRFVRKERWFASADHSEGGGFTHLRAAIRAGLAGSLDLVSQACSTRDSQRRAARDEVYAQKHPISQRTPKRSPAESLRAPAKRKAQPKRPASQAKQYLRAAWLRTHPEHIELAGVPGVLVRKTKRGGKAKVAFGQTELSVLPKHLTRQAPSERTLNALRKRASVSSLALKSAVKPSVPKASGGEPANDQAPQALLLASFTAALNQVLPA